MLFDYVFMIVHFSPTSFISDLFVYEIQIIYESLISFVISGSCLNIDVLLSVGRHELYTLQLCEVFCNRNYLSNHSYFKNKQRI